VTPTEKILIAVAIVAIAITLIGFALRRPLLRERRYWEKHDHKHRFSYEFIKDFAAPLLLAVLAGFLAYEFNVQRDTEAEKQKEATALLEVFTKGNGPDVAFFTAIGDQLTLHLQRYRNLLDVADKKSDQERKAYLDARAMFDEKAIYFFYGVFRAAQIDFLATKGYVIYPRIWMEVAFEGLCDHIVGCFMDVDERKPEADPREEAALYHYFGTAKTMYTAGTRRPSDPVPDLFGFVRLLKEFEGKIPAEITDNTPYEQVLAKAFAAFQARLRDRNHHPDSDEIIAAVDAIVGVDDYAFNTLFAGWYHQFQGAKVPVQLPPDPPREFLPYPLPRFDRQDGKRSWEDERHKAWREILEVVPAELGEKSRSVTKG